MNDQIQYGYQAIGPDLNKEKEMNQPHTLEQITDWGSQMGYFEQPADTLTADEISLLTEEYNREHLRNIVEITDY
jgi:hypothetical protein